MFKQFPLRVINPEFSQGQRVTLKVAVDVPENEKDGKLVDILNYMKSMQMKIDFINGWVVKNAPGYSVELVAGPRPVLERPGDRTSKVLAYEQEIRLNPGF
jgi:hypothetical protein